MFRQRLLLLCWLLIAVGCQKPKPVGVDVKQPVQFALKIEGLPAEQKADYQVSLPVGATPFAALIEAEKLGLVVERTGSGQQAFIKAIGGISNETVADGKFWLYYINDRQANLGADVYQLKAGEQITWKFENYRKSESSSR
jgi:hypothetical protein